MIHVLPVVTLHFYHVLESLAFVYRVFMVSFPLSVL